MWYTAFMVTPNLSELQRRAGNIPDVETARRMVASLSSAVESLGEGATIEIGSGISGWAQTFAKQMQQFQTDARSVADMADAMHSVAPEAVAIAKQMRDVLGVFRNARSALYSAEQEAGRRVSGLESRRVQREIENIPLRQRTQAQKLQYKDIQADIAAGRTSAMHRERGKAIAQRQAEEQRAEAAEQTRLHNERMKAMRAEIAAATKGMLTPRQGTLPAYSAAYAALPQNQPAARMARHRAVAERELKALMQLRGGAPLQLGGGVVQGAGAPSLQALREELSVAQYRYGIAQRVQRRHEAAGTRPGPDRGERARLEAAQKALAAAEEQIATARKQRQHVAAMAAQQRRQPGNMAGMAAAAYVGFTAEAANARRLAAERAAQAAPPGFNFAAWGASVGAMSQQAQAELMRQGRLPTLGGGIGARRIHRRAGEGPVPEVAELSELGLAYSDFHMTRLKERIQHVAAPIENLKAIGRDFAGIGAAVRMFGANVGGKNPWTGQSPLAALGQQLGSVGTTIGSGIAGRQGIGEIFDNLKPVFNELKLTVLELNNSFRLMLGSAGGFAKDIYQRTIGGRPPEMAAGPTAMEYIQQHGEAPKQIQLQMALASKELKMLQDQKKDAAEIAELENKQLALNEENMTTDERELALAKIRTKERDTTMRIVQREAAISEKMGGIYDKLFEKTKGIGAAFKGAFAPVAIAGGAALAVITKVALETAGLATRIQTAGAASRNTGVALHRMATGLEAMTGIRTAAEDMERFERAQRAINAGLTMGEPPTRRMIIAYGQLGMTFGDVTEVNETLYTRLRQLPQALREAHAATLGIPQALIAAINMGWTWNDILARGVNITQEQQAENYELSQRLARLKNDFSELAAEVGGPMLEILTAFKATLLPIVTGVADFARNNKFLVGTLVAMGAGLAAIIPIISMAATVMSAFTLAKTLVGAPVAIGLLIGAGVLSAALGSVAAGLAFKLGNDVTKAMAEAAETGFTTGIENAERERAERADTDQHYGGVSDPLTALRLARADADMYRMTSLMPMSPEEIEQQMREKKAVRTREALRVAALTGRSAMAAFEDDVYFTPTDLKAAAAALGTTVPVPEPSDWLTPGGEKLFKQAGQHIKQQAETAPEWQQPQQLTPIGSWLQNLFGGGSGGGGGPTAGVIRQSAIENYTQNVYVNGDMDEAAARIMNQETVTDAVNAATNEGRL